MSANPPCAIAEKIEELSKLPLKDIKKRWADLFKKEPPKDARGDYLIRAICFRIQERACGGITVAAARILKRSNSSDKPSRQKSIQSPKLKVGSRLLREWQGHTHEVIVIEDGFLYQAGNFKSLSEIARKIAGTRWSGPRFFGLKGKRSDPTYTGDLNFKPNSSGQQAGAINGR